MNRLWYTIHKSSLDLPNQPFETFALFCDNYHDFLKTRLALRF